MKWCGSCETTKPREAFAKNASHSSGLQTWCRACLSERQKIARERRRAIEEAGGKPPAPQPSRLDVIRARAKQARKLERTAREAPAPLADDEEEIVPTLDVRELRELGL
jgi:hypothetical protein